MIIKGLLKRFYKWGFSGTDAEKYNPQRKNISICRTKYSCYFKKKYRLYFIPIEFG